MTISDQKNPIGRPGVSRYYMILLVGLLSACSTVPISHEPSTIPLTKGVHFASPDGSDAVASPGLYRVEQVESTALKFTPHEEGRQAAITVQALSTSHEAALSAPLALSIPYAEDEHHVMFLTPNGRALDAVGTYSGVRSRGATRPLTPQAIRQYLIAFLSLALSPNNAHGGSTVTGIVSVQPAAPGNGILVGLSSNSNLAQVPSSILIAGGQSQATFPIHTGAVANSTTVIISAFAGGITRTAPLAVTSVQVQCPPGAGSPCNNQGTCNPNDGQCTCYAGFNGFACQYGNATTCNGHGTADYNGTCSCMPGFTGAYCTTPVQ